MLDEFELAQAADDFGGVAEAQIRRDHFIGHLLHAIAGLDLPLVFFGGTALARTYLASPQAGGRLSEDIDLYAHGRKTAARLFEDEIPRRLRREFPGTTWEVRPTAVRTVAPAVLMTGDRMRVQVQLLDAEQHCELATWPTVSRQLETRYSDVPTTVLMVPSLSAFAGMKTVAFMDRRTARDLYDLAALVNLGAITQEVATSVRRLTGWLVHPSLFTGRPPSGWHEQLAHQTPYLPTGEECLETVRRAYERAGPGVQPTT